MKFYYKYYPAKYYAIDNLKNCCLCFNSLRSFEDKTEGKFEFVKEHGNKNYIENAVADELSETYTEYIMFRYKILCVTTDPDTPYMWEQYE